MKNKGRKHMANSANCKGCLTFITRPIESMAAGGKPSKASRKWIQKKWNKRVRGYLKTAKGIELFINKTKI